MFQLRSHLATLHNGIHSVKIDILSILNQVLVIRSQKLTPALLNPLDLISLLIKLETQMVSHPRLVLPQWNSEKNWYMYKFMKSQSCIDTLYVILLIPIVDKSLQFHLFRIHNIPLVHPVHKKSFRYSIQGEYLTIRSDAQYTSFPLSTNIMAFKYPMDNFAHINSPLYAVDTTNSCSYVLFLQKKK